MRSDLQKLEFVAHITVGFKTNIAAVELPEDLKPELTAKLNEFAPNPKRVKGWTCLDDARVPTEGKGGNGGRLPKWGTFHDDYSRHPRHRPPPACAGGFHLSSAVQASRRAGSICV